MGVKRVCSFRRHVCSKHDESSSNQVASITMVTLPKLSNSYACISLKTGTLVIGSLVIGTLVAFVIGIVASIGFLAAPTVGSAIIPHKLISNQRNVQKSKWAGGSAEETRNFP